MANSISYDRRPDLGFVQMSNGLTSVFLAVLVLGASAVAQTERHREVAAWLRLRNDR